MPTNNRAGVPPSLANADGTLLGELSDGSIVQFVGLFIYLYFSLYPIFQAPKAGYNSKLP